MSHGQGKPQNGQGNVREKSGNFVRAHGWTPWCECVGVQGNVLRMNVSHNTLATGYLEYQYGVAYITMESPNWYSWMKLLLSSVTWTLSVITCCHSLDRHTGTTLFSSRTMLPHTRHGEQWNSLPKSKWR